jgi:hypothetical protein
LLNRSLLQVVRKSVLAEVHKVVSEQEYGQPVYGFPTLGDIDFTSKGAKVFQELSDELYGKDFFSEALVDTKKGRFIYTAKKDRAQEIASGAPAYKLYVASMKPLGKWCIYWWKRFPSGWRIDLTAKGEESGERFQHASMEQTVPINGDEVFLSLNGYLDGLLRPKGFKRLGRKGSTSWIETHIHPVNALVRFKLCYFGPPYIKFGVRRDFVIQRGLTPDSINCPDIFMVRPSSVEFVGFTVRNDQASRIRIAEVVEKLT